MEINFRGKVALITGASQGIGRDIALQLDKCGAQVIAVARNETLLQTLKTENPSIRTVALDITDWTATKETISNLGPIDLLVNNAGIAIIKPLLTFTQEDVDKLFKTNVNALINITQIVAKNLLDRKSSGSIVNVSSQCAKIGLEGHAAYCGTKGAVDAFTRAAALELGPHNIRVNCVNPTVINTEMTRTGWPDPVKAKENMEKIPLKRWGEIREVSDAVLYLLSDKATMITGVSLFADGGYTAV